MASYLLANSEDSDQTYLLCTVCLSRQSGDQVCHCGHLLNSFEITFSTVCLGVRVLNVYAC